MINTVIYESSNQLVEQEKMIILNILYRYLTLSDTRRATTLLNADKIPAHKGTVISFMPNASFVAPSVTRLSLNGTFWSRSKLIQGNIQPAQ